MENATLKFTSALLVVVAMLLAGCSDNSVQPELDAGTIALSINLIRPVENAMQLAPPVADSAAVLVFRPDGTYETGAGERLGAGVVEIDVSCLAENNKRIGVNLYLNGVMIFHGSDEDVDVTSQTRTDVTVAVESFFVSDVSLPAQTTDGLVFDLAWNGAPAATAYLVEESLTGSFADDDIVFETITVNTTISFSRGPGAHYFRVAPVTEYAVGAFAGPRLCYVLGGGNVTALSSFSDAEVIPGEDFTIGGENLDYPGTVVEIGDVSCEIIDAGWDFVTVEVPWNATSGTVTVVSSLGWVESPVEILIQRIAYVTNGGSRFDQYKEYIEYYQIERASRLPETISVAKIPVDQLDWRDMSVFDLIVIASDTGNKESTWGGGRPSRANSISSSGANVLAIGVGGAIYLSLATNAASGVDISFLEQTAYYVPDGSASVFNTPYWVTNEGAGSFQFCITPQPQIAMSIPVLQKPLAVDLFANLALGDERWPLALFNQASSQGPKRYYFWGYDGDPYELTGQGADCLSNVVFDLYTDGDVPAPATSSRQ